MILVSLAALILGLVGGFWAREIINYLKRIQTAVLSLKIRQAKQDLKEKKMNFADPAEFNWEEMDDQERIRFLNS